jgi:hypothetical protein
LARTNPELKPSTQRQVQPVMTTSADIASFDLKAKVVWAPFI